jgi:signal transduction histidine kinase
MKLSEFVDDNAELILQEWESDARIRLPSAKGMSDDALRDSVGDILAAAANEIAAQQTKEKQEQKSQATAPAHAYSAAYLHGALRQGSGFTLSQLIAEFSALRAAVMRHWQAHLAQLNPDAINDMVRFNESIDRALAESAEAFSIGTARTRDTFLGILGHDLRAPLATLSMAGSYLVRGEPGPERSADVGATVQRATATMTVMVDDLLEYSRTQLGDGIPVVRRPADFRHICEAALHDARSAHPNCIFDFAASGDLSGTVDGPRLQQVVTNVLVNAAQYGEKGHAIKVLITGDVDSLVLQVENRGQPIPAESLQAVFGPKAQVALRGPRDGRPPTSLGLGLFIAREITEAHGGKIAAKSSKDAGTVFTVKIPKKASGSSGTSSRCDC